jgi:hypothetical protein
LKKKRCFLTGRLLEVTRTLVVVVDGHAFFGAVAASSELSLGRLEVEQLHGGEGGIGQVGGLLKPLQALGG